MLLGRETELQFLERYFACEGSQIVVVYGRRGIGKTALLKQFAAGKISTYYQARSASAREQRCQWAGELREQGINVRKHPEYPELFDSVLPQPGTEAVGEALKPWEKQVLFLDEFHHMVRVDAGFMPELLRFVEGRILSRPVMVVLCTSASGWVENAMVSKLGSAAFALSGLLKVRELKFKDMRRLFPGFSLRDSVEAYAVLGGFPGLWRSLDQSLTMRENILRHILPRESRLYNEMSVQLTEELREPAVYNTILASMAGGFRKLNDIYLRTGFSRAKISVYLKNLMELELVEKVFSTETAGRANSQKGIYRIVNPYVRFYFRFLYPNMSLLEQLTPEGFYERMVEAAFPAFVEEAYRKICGEELAELGREGVLPYAYGSAGEWIGKNGNLDIVARDGDGHTLVALCSYARRVTFEDYEWLLFCAKKARLKPDEIFLFSAADFDESLREEAGRDSRLKLFPLESER